MVEVLAVGASTHSGAEDGLDDEGVVGLEGSAVGSTEGVSELLGVVLHVGVQGEGDELETAAGKCMLVLQSCKLKDGRGRHGSYRVNHRRPSVALCFFSFSSLTTSS